LNADLGAAGDQLVGNADLLRGILAGSGDCIKILDLDGRLQFMSEGGKRVMEVEDFSVLKGCPWPDFWVGSGNEQAQHAVRRAAQGEVVRFTGAADTAKGTPRYWDVQVSPILGANGKPAHLLSISRDITEEHQAAVELREAAARQTLLTNELDHRIKNILAMVNGIARQTIRGDDVNAAREAFSSRLIALSRAHDILTSRSWTNAPMAEVIDSALAPHRMGTGRIRVSGPELFLPANASLALALAIHELATNAVKYGALSNEVGIVIINWLIETDGEKLLRFKWEESGGPHVAGRPERKGFGSRLVNGVLAAYFAGTVQTHFEASGFMCELKAPLDRLLAEADRAFDSRANPSAISGRA
jgi:PAS domain S-box-containing protein